MHTITIILYGTTKLNYKCSLQAKLQIFLTVIEKRPKYILAYNIDYFREYAIALGNICGNY